MYGYRNTAVLDLLIKEPKKYLADELGAEVIDNLPAELLRILSEDLLGPAEIIDREYMPWAASFIEEAGKSFASMEPELRLGLLNGKRSMVPTIKGSRTAAELLVSFSLAMHETRSKFDSRNRARLDAATDTTRTTRHAINDERAELASTVKSLVEESISREWLKSDEHYNGVVLRLASPFNEVFRNLMRAPLINVSIYPVHEYWWDTLEPLRKTQNRLITIRARHA